MDEQKQNLLHASYRDIEDYETDDTLSNAESGTSPSYLSRNPKLRRLQRLINPWRTTLLVVSSLVLALTFYLVGRLAPSPFGSGQGFHKTGHCGNSSAEALANGCILDLIPGAWVHPQCYDAELEAEFLSYAPENEGGKWHWYRDPEGKSELSEDEMRATGGPNPVYVSLAYHDAHCAFTWRKLHRAVVMGRAIDSHIGSYVHTKHCSGRLSKARSDPTFPQWVAPARFYNIFTHCDLPANCESLPHFSLI